MPRQVILLLLPYIFLVSKVNAQEHLLLSAPRYCQYGGDTLSNELYTFPNDPEIEDVVSKILKLTTGEEANFIFSAANVGDVVAVLDGDKRYILCNRLYFNDLKDKDLWAVLLAHAIGHHANKHTFPRLDAARRDEDTEADEFMGYALCRLGASQNFVESIPVRLPLVSHIDDNNKRRLAILRGWNRADARIHISPSASFFEDEKGKIDPSFPHFKLPPPEWSDTRDVSSCFSFCKTLGDVRDVLVSALEKRGYTNQDYFSVPQGFALITRLEQFNENGTCKSDQYRWKLDPVREESFTSIMGYFKALVVAEPGHFRTFAFIISPFNIVKKSDYRVTREDAINWLGSGINRLPPEVAVQKYTLDKMSVSALVYEFEVSESTRIAKQTRTLTAEKHLRMSGITSELEQITINLRKKP